MTPNGALVFTALVTAGALAARGFAGLGAFAALLAVFSAVALRPGAIVALTRTLAIVAPLAAFLMLVWVVVVGRAPDEIASGVTGSREAAALHAGIVSARLFVIVYAAQAMIAKFSSSTPLAFVAAMSAPLGLKRLAVLTLSFVETLRQGVARAHVALVGAGVCTRGFSVRNVLRGWVLIQTVWLSTVTIALGRMQTKWPIENTLDRLDRALAAPAPRLSLHDAAWIALALSSVITAVWLGR